MFFWEILERKSFDTIFAKLVNNERLYAKNKNKTEILYYMLSQPSSSYQSNYPTIEYIKDDFAYLKIKHLGQEISIFDKISYELLGNAKLVNLSPKNEMKIIIEVFNFYTINAQIFTDSKRIEHIENIESLMPF